MKIDKLLQKKCVLRIKDKAINSGYKKIQNTIFKIENGNVIFINFLIVNSEVLIYSINIKRYSYDNIFWKILNMDENIKKSDSLRVNGAFAAPAVLIANGKIKLNEDIDVIVDNFMNNVTNDVDNFLKNNDITDYIFSHNQIIDAAILQCLSYIDSNHIPEAIKLAKNQIMMGETGRFENKGKGFFELVLSYYG